MDTDEDLYHATPQTRGKIAHASLDAKNYSTRKDVLTALPVYSSCQLPFFRTVFN